MVDKRDFDKILVNLLRSNPEFVNIALIDAEGIPISFAIKSRKYQIKPATLGSKTKVLLYLSKAFANSISITDPIIQVFFFESVATIIVNLKVVNFFIIMDIKGWPIDGKILYENFIKVKELLSQIEDTKDDALRSLLESEKKAGPKISDISDTWLKIIAKNINTLNQIQINPISVSKGSILLNPNDYTSYSNYLRQNITTNKKIIEGLSTLEDGPEFFKVENTHPNFGSGTRTLIENSYKELETFNFKTPIWILNIFEKSELILLTKLGKFGTSNVYTGLLMENRLGNLTELVNLVYKLSSEMNAVKPDDYLRSLKQSLEVLGFSVNDLNIKIEKSMISSQFELAELFIERGANLLLSEEKYSEAGNFFSKLGDLAIKKNEPQGAEQFYLKAADYHLKERNYERAGDENLKLGNMANVTNNIPKALEYFNSALKYYKSCGKAEKAKKINTTLKELKDSIKFELKDYINSATGESLPFSLMEKKFQISEKMLVMIFRELFESNEISGQINLIKKRYTKKKFGTDESIVGESGVAGKLYILPEINRSAMVSEQRQIEAALTNTEDTFEKIGFPFEKYIKYHDNLSKSNFIEQKIKIYSAGVESNKCIICFRMFTKKDQITDCGNGHYYHLKCMQLWIENQKKCPACDENILNNLKTHFLETLEIKDDLMSLQDVINSLKAKISNLESQLNKREEQIYLMKEYSKKDKSVFEKLMVERDSKHAMERDLKKSNRIVQELRSLLEIIKK
jgi:tetratricopeptide (TPR) repeat protein